MDHNPIETRLIELGANWPAGSVVESVSKRIQSQSSHPMPPNYSKANRRFAWVAVGASAFVTVLLCAWFGAVVSRPVHALEGIEERFRQLNSLYVKGTLYRTYEVDGKKRVKEIPLEQYAARPSRYFHTWNGVQDDGVNELQVKTGYVLADGKKTMFVSDNDKRAIQTESDALVVELQMESLLQNQWMRQIICGPTADYRLVGPEDLAGRRTHKYECVSTQGELSTKSVIWINITSGLPVRSASYLIDSEGHEIHSVIYETIEANAPPPTHLLSFDPPNGYQLVQAGAQPVTSANFETSSAGNGRYRSAFRYSFAIDRRAILVFWHHSVAGPGAANGPAINDPEDGLIEPVAELHSSTGNRPCDLHPVRTQIDDGKLWHWSLVVPADHRPINSDELIQLKFNYPKGGSSSNEDYPLRLDDERLKTVITRWQELGKVSDESQPDVTLVRLRWLASRFLTQGDAGDQQKIEQK